MGRLSDDDILKSRVWVLKADTILSALDADDRKTLTRWLNDPAKFSARAISRTLRDQGIELSASAINIWRDRHGVS